MEDEVIFTEDNGVCVITLNRPEIKCSYLFNGSKNKQKS